ncbi:DMT family transporter [Polycladidibacter hongkongensis]|uniref:DMT family transporter n=1 Tax=Polycladidibacter hongkongensis TaxID=1647556 RepID=UPI00083252F0|nr:DMT family transporter [Pseudovibrio hongkongensis]
MSATSSQPSLADQQSNAVKGMLTMVCAMSMLPIMDGFAKLLSAYLPVLEISFGRFFFQTLLSALASLFVGAGLRHIISEVSWMQMARGLFLAVASLFFFSAVKFLPLPDAIATFFVQPMILTVLSAVFLGERVGPRRWAAVTLGLVGVLIVIRPGSSVFSAYSLLPLCAATCFACYLLLTRKLSGSASLLGIQFSTGLAGTLVLGPLLLVSTALDFEPGAFIMPQGTQWLMLLCMGAISSLGHLLVVLAFNNAPASLLAPINYLEIVSATVFSYFIFDEVPTGITWLGIALITAGGIYITQREHKVAKQLKAAEMAQQTRAERT